MKWTACAVRIVLILIALMSAVIGGAYIKLTNRVVGQTVEREGVRIHYTDEGKGEPVILLHGFAVNSDLNWRLPGIHEALCPHFRVIAMDLRGHGLSDKPHEPEAYGLRMVEDIATLMDALGIERAHLAGYSLGGLLALKFAAAHPQRVQTLCVLGAGWIDPQEGDLLGSLEEIARQLRAGRAVSPLSAVLPNARPPSTLHRMVVALMTRYFNDPLALAAVVESLPQIAISQEEIRRLSFPVCVIVGEADPLHQSAERLCAAVAHWGFTLIQKADHLLALWRRDFHEAFLKYLLSQKEGL